LQKELVSRKRERERELSFTARVVFSSTTTNTGSNIYVSSDQNGENKKVCVFFVHLIGWVDMERKGKLRRKAVDRLFRDYV